MNTKSFYKTQGWYYLPYESDDDGRGFWTLDLGMLTITIDSCPGNWSVRVSHGESIGDEIFIGTAKTFKEAKKLGYKAVREILIQTANAIPKE